MTPILLRSIVKTTAVILPIAIVIVALVLGIDHAIGVAVGGLLAFADGMGLVYLAGALLEPESLAKTTSGAKRSKVVLSLLLVMKLVVVAFLLWAALSWLHVSGLGIVIGIGMALAGLVIGANRGSTSKAGQKAMADAEARIRAEMDLEDKERDSG
jgi:hypothetical protein